MLPRVVSGIVLLLTLPTGWAATLEYRVEGLAGPLRNNVEAWLGDFPETEPERVNFLSSVRQRTADSLKALGYYRPDIDLQLDRQRQPWQLLLSVDAGEPVVVKTLDIDIDGAAESDSAFVSVLANLPLKQGDIFHHGQYESLKSTLLGLGQRRGYFDAALTSRRVEIDAEQSLARIALNYQSGARYHFGALRYDQSLFAAEPMAALQDFRQGEPFALEKLQLLQGQLQRTGYFSAVTVIPRLAEREANQVPVDIQLVPAKRHTFDVGVGFSTDTRQRLSITWRTPRINRYGHSQESRLEYSAINPSGRFTYTIPLTHPLDDVLQLRARVEQNEFGDLDSRQQEAGVRREQRRDDWVRSWSLRVLNERWDVGLLEKNEDYLLPGFSLAGKQRQGSLVNPDAGFSQFYMVEAGSTSLGSDADLVRLVGKWVYVHTFAHRHRLVGRAELGALLLSDSGRQEKLAPSLNFFVGGSQSLRGFAYQSIGNDEQVILADGSQQLFTLGGERLALASIEYQYQFSPNWRAALFGDAGDAFDPGNYQHNYAAGVGLHYLTPVGAIKLELATPLSEENPGWRIHLNIGAEF